MSLVSVSGDEAAAAKLDRVGAAAYTQSPAIRRAAERTARGIRGVPVETGRLERSIVVLDSGAQGFVVGSRNVPYARFVFHGTKHMAAQPPKVPSNIGPDTADEIGSNLVRA